MSEADLKAIDSRTSDLSTQVQAISQGCRQLDAGRAPLFAPISTLPTHWTIQHTLISDCRAEGAQQLPDHRGNHIRDPGAERRVFRLQGAPGEDQVSDQSCHTRAEGDGMGHNQTWVQIQNTFFHIPCSCIFPSGLQGETSLRERVEEEEETGDLFILGLYSSCIAEVLWICMIKCKGHF